MYCWYKHIKQNGVLSLQYEDDLSLAGCNNGIIANELKEILHPEDNPPIGWVIPISEKYNKQDYSVIIDIKPNNDEVFLCELDMVFGYSFSGWSPIMLRLKKLYSDETKEDVDKENFLYPEDPEIIYTMLYLYGSIENGKINGTWRFPGPSPTNSLLLWPEAMSFFHNQVKEHDPHFLNENIKMISLLNKNANELL